MTQDTFLDLTFQEKLDSGNVGQLSQEINYGKNGAVLSCTATSVLGAKR